METIKLQGLTELMAQEKLTEVPELVQRYLGVETRSDRAEGNHFRVCVLGQSNPVSGHGIAYSNELRIEKRNGEGWSLVYSTGMMKYRGAYADDIDNKDLHFFDIVILSESESEVVYGVNTGAGNVKVYRFSEKSPKLEVSFNTRRHKETQERIGLLQKVITDPVAFCEYITSKSGGWQTYVGKLSIWEENSRIFDRHGNTPEYNQVAEKADLIVVIGRCWDRDYDAICTDYKLYFWVRGQGIGVSNIYGTQNRHPGGRFYCVSVGFKATQTNRGRDFANISMTVGNRNQNWRNSHDFRLEWPMPEATEFERKLDEAMNRVVQLHHHEHPLYKPTRITDSVVDFDRKVAAWILFEQIDTDRLDVDGSEGWLGDQFRYSLWKLNGTSDEVQLYEDHAYIRPNTKSELTGTRGRNCWLKNLHLEEGVIKVTHPKGEKVEEEQSEELTFNL